MRFRITPGVPGDRWGYCAGAVDGLRRSRAAGIEAVFVAGLVGTVEAVAAVRASGRGSVGSVLVMAALATAGWIVVALVGRGLLAGGLGLAPLARWRVALGDGAARAVAAWRGGLAVLATLGYGWLAFRAIAWVHVAYRFRDPGPVALLLVGGLVPLALGTLVLALAIDRRIAPRLGAVHLARRHAHVAVAVAALVGLVLPLLVVHRAVPAVDLAGVGLGALLAVGLALARAGRLGQRRGAVIAALLVGGLAASGSLAVGHAPEARAVVVEQGLASRAVLRSLLALGDGDGDGYAGERFGGSDCDDSNPARSPIAIDVAGNGVDENCTGADAPLVVATPAAHAPRPVPTARPTIVLVSIDALRADHLGAWGYRRATSPHLDAFAARATRYAWAVTPSPSTRHAVPALLSGRLPSRTDRAARPPALAEALQAAGYTTAAILCCDHVVAPDVLRGFATVDGAAEASRLTSPGQANAAAVIATATRWLSARPPASPAFLWIHLYDPHFPYVTPPDDAGFGDRDVDRYDAEIRSTDRALAALFAAVDPARTIVVVASDHGDEFGEHGLRFHARSLYNQVIRVPLVIAAPGLAPGVVEIPVSLVDVMPTLLELAGVPAVAGLSGRSLRDPLPRPILLELPPDRTITRDLVGVIHAGRKVIWDREANAWSAFTLDDVADASAEDATPEDRALLLQTLDVELGQR